ncbi:hypothetical protein [Mesoplasma melaleucae]|uniref:Uncharacterized protein n=1 Tax=Mesoplasma melaleucae TaxID=81459 RepID=A0A2K8NWK5_9MOLU|nr:hypothetical protein [Mesoplasma melaleucae]ATZ18114.1 hypothetical protein EMELA_v1c05890 [Mesoplasma melaleucae]
MTEIKNKINKEFIENLNKQSEKCPVLIYDKNNTTLDRSQDIYGIIFSKSEDMDIHAYLGNFICCSDNIEQREFCFKNHEHSLKNFEKQIYILRDYIQHIMPKYYEGYKILKIFKCKTPNFF